MIHGRTMIACDAWRLTVKAPDVRWGYWPVAIHTRFKLCVPSILLLHLFPKALIHLSRSAVNVQPCVAWHLCISSGIVGMRLLVWHSHRYVQQGGVSGCHGQERHLATDPSLRWSAYLEWSACRIMQSITDTISIWMTIENSSVLI